MNLHMGAPDQAGLGFSQRLGHAPSYTSYQTEMTGKPRRHPDWPTRLHVYVESQRHAAFDWARNNNLSFAAGVVHAIRGDCPPLPAWKTAGEAMRVVEREGGLRNALQRLGPFEPVPIAWARRGDLALMPAQQSAEEIVAVCLAEVWAAPGPDGLQFFGQIRPGAAAWRT